MDDGVVGLSEAAALRVDRVGDRATGRGANSHRFPGREAILIEL
jgi:hypothetical protein